MSAHFNVEQNMGRADQAELDHHEPEPPAGVVGIEPADPDIPAGSRSDAGSGARDLRFEFTGSGGEYFRIWIVNLVLSGLTLGIYSAWAKVRREQYFHRNTMLDGSGFDYHGKATAILFGRLIAVGFFVALSVLQKVNTTAYMFASLAAVPLIPWFIMRALRFRAANSSFRGLRFHHRGTYGQALKAFVGHGLLLLPTLFLWLPMWRRAITRFQIGKLSYGDTDFKCEPPIGKIYGVYAIIGALLMVQLVIGVVLAKQVGGFGAALSVFVFIFMLALVVGPYMRVRLINLTWNATVLGPHRFISRQKIESYWFMHFSNLALTLVTLGLYWPWAKVREAAYFARHLSIEAIDLDAFVGHAQSEKSAVGQEVADMFDLDFSI
jgi:uncharacterized membrane protein YjgN (DUF898 family)